MPQNFSSRLFSSPAHWPLNDGGLILYIKHSVNRGLLGRNTSSSRKQSLTHYSWYMSHYGGSWIERNEVEWLGKAAIRRKEWWQKAKRGASNLFWPTPALKKAEHPIDSNIFWLTPVSRDRTSNKSQYIRTYSSLKRQNIQHPAPVFKDRTPNNSGSSTERSLTSTSAATHRGTRMLGNCMGKVDVLNC